ncbi:MAG TPA: SelB C-terminal domain-containing protein, partial [Candidatus Binatia bacterium]
KADLAPSARIREVEEEIDILTVGTGLENSPKLAVSSVTGQGLEELKQMISATLQASTQTAPTGYFRLPVDRAFVLQGHGVVVTGTALSGEIKVGEQVRCLPGDYLFRVRSLQVHGKSVGKAGWGQRVAMNLTGPERASIERGQVICHEKLSLTSDRFDAFLEVRPAAAKGIKNHQRLRIHMGAAERLGKIVLLAGKDKLDAKQSAYCQITLNQPLLVMRGDHFVARDETAQRTLGGGVVIHPLANGHRKNEPDLLRRLETLHRGELAQVVENFLAENTAFALPTESIYQFMNLREEEARAKIESIKSLRALNAEGDTLYTTEAKWRQLREQMLGLLKSFHVAHPLMPGMDMEELRGKLRYALTPKLFRAVIELLLAEKLIAREENLLRVPTHRVQLGGQEKILMDRIKQILGSQPLAPPDVKDLEKQAGVSRQRLTEVLRLLERDGSVVRVTTDMYFLASSIEQLRALLKKHLAEKGEMSAATFRDLINSSRKYTIPLLEFFDRDGLTIRIGDIRRLKSSPGADRARTAR